MTAEELRKAKWLVADAHKAVHEAYVCFPGLHGPMTERLWDAREHLEELRGKLEKEEPDADA